ASAALPLAQTLKGLLYVGVTAVLVYALARLSTRSIREEQARLQAQHARDERRLATLLDLTRTLLAEPRPGSSRLQILTETIVETLDVERASVWEIDAASGKLVCRDLYE